jgi:hypothetical protein
MVGMVLVLIAVVVVAAGAVVVFLRLRPRGGDLDSVRSYHSALGTLEHLSDRPGPTGVNVVGPADRPVAEPRVRPHRGAESARAPAVPPVPVRGRDEFPEPGTPLVFDDARPSDRVPARSTVEGAGPMRIDRAQRHALDSMNRRPRRATTAVVAVVLVALFAGLAYSGSRHDRSKRTATKPPASTPTTGGTHPARSTSSTTSGHHGTGDAKGKGKGKGKTTTTTAPSRLVPVSTSGASATYQVASATYQLSLSATQECWVLARSTATGATLWTGTMQAGGNQLIPATGAVTLELGAPGVTLTVDRVPVVFPTPFHTPFEAMFEPATAGAPATPTTTTPTTTTPTTTAPSATSPSTSAPTG